jgi:hypothetical protein
VTVLADTTLGAGLTAFLIVLALIVAAALLFRSMTRHLRKVPRSFDDEPPDE